MKIIRGEKSIEKEICNLASKIFGPKITVTFGHYGNLAEYRLRKTTRWQWNLFPFTGPGNKIVGYMHQSFGTNGELYPYLDVHILNSENLEKAKEFAKEYETLSEKEITIFKEF